MNMEVFSGITIQGTPLTVTNVKRIQGKALLALSNGEVLSMPRAMLKERPYRSGMPFDQDAFRAFLNDRAYPFALDKAVSLLASRARTESEISESLRRNAYPETAIARVMQKLHEAGYINDREFAQQWLSSRTSKGLGTRRIRLELRQKGVRQEEIDEVLSGMETDDLLAGAIKAAHKASRGKDLSSPADRQKVLAALARRGFDFSTAQTAIKQIMDEEYA